MFKKLVYSVVMAAVLCEVRETAGMEEITSRDITQSSIFQVDHPSKLKLNDLVDEMDYDGILDHVNDYLDSNTKKFNSAWERELTFISSSELLSAIMKNDEELYDFVKKLYVWCEVTAEIICNYESYSLSDLYIKELSTNFNSSFYAIRGDKSMLLDDFIEKLLDVSSVFSYATKTDNKAHQFRWSEVCL